MTSTRADRGFTLLEVLLAFALLALFLAAMSLVQSRAVESGAQALDLRDLRVSADTVFRKFVYEIDRVNDGDTAGFDSWYAEYIGLRGQARDRWSIYRGVVHKERGLAAGTDPTGKLKPLFDDGSGTSSTTSTTSTSSTSGTTGTGSATDPESQAGEEVYMLTLEVFQGADGGEPLMTLRTIVPIPPSELEAEK